MREDRTRNEVNLSLGIEHLQIALRCAERGRKTYFDEHDPDTRRLVESELRKAYESLNKLGPSVWKSNPRLPRDRVGQVRQLLTHDYAGVDADQVWNIATREARPLLHRLKSARVPTDADPRRE